MPDIFDREDRTPPTPAEQFRRGVRTRLPRFLREAAELSQDQWMMIWNNPQGLTPQEAFDALGTQGVQYIQFAQALRQFVNGLRPGTLTWTVPNQITQNPDGTVTIGAPV